MLHAARLGEDAASTRPVTAVVSAMKGVTDRLLQVGEWLRREKSASAKEAEAMAELHLAPCWNLRLEPEEHERVEQELAF